jgi:hypothetical protein
MGYPIDVDCRPVALPRVRDRVGTVWIRAQCRLDRGSGGFPLNLGVPDLDSLVSYAPPSDARGPPDDAGVE